MNWASPPATASSTPGSTAPEKNVGGRSPNAAAPQAQREADARVVLEILRRWRGGPSDGKGTGRLIEMSHQLLRVGILAQGPPLGIGLSRGFVLDLAGRTRQQSPDWGPKPSELCQLIAASLDAFLALGGFPPAPAKQPLVAFLRHWLQGEGFLDRKGLFTPKLLHLVWNEEGHHGDPNPLADPPCDCPDMG